MKEVKKEKKKHKAAKSKHEKDDTKSCHVREKITKTKETDPKTQKSSTIPEQDDEMFSDEKIIRDYPKSCHPIHLFVDDRAELIEQLFSTVRVGDLQKILPETLKSMKIDELKKICLQQLEVMTRDFVLHVLAGNDPTQYPAKPSEEKKSDARSLEQGTVEHPNPLKRKPEEDEAVVSSTTETCTFAKRRVDQCQVKTRVGSSESLELFSSSTNTDFMVKELVEDKGSPRNVVESIQEPVGELMELEMRARAIRSYLKAKGFSSSEEEDSQSDMGTEDNNT